MRWMSDPAHSEKATLDTDRPTDEDDDHLSDLDDGAGCTEIWEHLSERRAKAAENADD